MQKIKLEFKNSQKIVLGITFIFAALVLTDSESSYLLWPILLIGAAIIVLLSINKSK